MKKSRKALLSSALSLLLCFSMLLGTTFAWFTDSVTSTGNIIKSGKLDVEMTWSDTKDGTFKDASTGAIFNYEYWEPGFTQIKYVKIANVGNLAFRYVLNIIPNTTVAEGTVNLADVIDVYLVDTSKGDITRETLASLSPVGTLSQLMADSDGAAHGVMLPVDGATNVTLNDADKPVAVNGSATYCIALKMQESAGNEYQNLTVGGSFSVQLLATQYTYENDVFGNDYDSDATFPVINGGFMASASIAGVVENNQLIESVNIASASDAMSAVVPEGVTVEEGTTELTLTVDTISSSSNIQLEDGQVARSLDVHIAGVAEDNDVPMTIYLGAILPKGLASYNVKLVHVEMGGSVEMTMVDALSELNSHNEFYYDPVTGEVSVCLKSFSEVAAVAEIDNPWNGVDVDTSWYNTTDTEFTLTDAADFAGFAQIVGGMADGIEKDSFAGKTVSLNADINLGGNNGVIFNPVGYYFTDDENEDGTTGDYYCTVQSFEGTFNGNGKTIADIRQNTWQMKGDDPYYDLTQKQYYNDGMGIFGFVLNGTIENLTVNNFQSDGEFCTTGCVAAYASGTSTFKNITVVKSNPRAYNVPNGGVVGYAYAEDGQTNVITFNNVTVDSSNKISALWGSWDVACGGILGRVNGSTTINLTNCEVGAVIDVYNDVCGNYQYYQYRYSGMLIGTVGGDGDPTTGDEKVNFSNVNVYIGDWADYYFCEFEKNSGASYTEDFQFSRVERNEIVFDEYNMPTSCTHTHTENEDKMALYLPFGQLYTGYGWGASPVSAADGVTVTNYFYMITYLDGDNVIAVEYVTEGQNDETHNVANAYTIERTYTPEGKTFKNWVNTASEVVTTVSAGNRNNLALYPVYENIYIARWVDEDGNVIYTQEYTAQTSAWDTVEGPASSSSVLAFDHWEIRSTDEDGNATYTVLTESTPGSVASNVTIYPYYNLVSGDGMIGLTGHDDDGDGRYDWYSVEAASGLSGEVEIPGEVNGVPVTVITDLSDDFINTGVTSIVIKDGVTEIGANAFAMTSGLSEITIPTTVTSIGANAFSTDLGAVISKQVTIYYAGTWEQWKAICSDNWDSGLGDGSQVICSDGTYELSCSWFVSDHDWTDWTLQQ